MHTAAVTALALLGLGGALAGSGVHATPIKANATALALDERVTTSALFPCQHWILNIDFPGNDIGSTPVPWNDLLGALRCFELCRVMDGCHAVTWTIFNGGTCWFKSRAENGVYITSPDPYPPPASFVIEPPANPEGRCQPLYVRVPNCDMPGNDIGSAPGANLDACFVPCLQQTPSCLAVTWSDYNGGTCWFKSHKLPCVASPTVHSALLSILPPWDPYFPKQ